MTFIRNVIDGFIYTIAAATAIGTLVGIGVALAMTVCAAGGIR